MVITFCGPLKFWDKMVLEAKRLLSNHVVILPVPYAKKITEDFDDDSKQVQNFYRGLDIQHTSSIINSDAIYVINDYYNGSPYIGFDMEGEIRVANRNGKLIFYMNEEEGGKYLYTYDGMKLGIPEDYILKPLNYLNLDGINKIDRNDILEFKLDPGTMNKVDIAQYIKYIRSNYRIQDLMKTGLLGAEYGNKFINSNITKASEIDINNVIGNIVAFTPNSIFVKMSDPFFIKNADNYVAIPRIYGNFTPVGVFNIYTIVTWDIVSKLNASR